MENSMYESRLDLKRSGGSTSTRSVVPKNPTAMLVMAHGSGAGIENKFFPDFQQELAKLGIASFSFNFLYKELKKSTPFRMTEPINTFTDVWEHVRTKYPTIPIFVSGKSYGGRVGSMALVNLPNARGLIFMGYPFHPPGNLEKLRTDHLYKIDLPMLFLQGSRDTFSTLEIADTFTKAHKKSTLVWLEDGDHSWVPRKSSGMTQMKLMGLACLEIKKFCELYRN